MPPHARFVHYPHNKFARIVHIFVIIVDLSCVALLYWHPEAAIVAEARAPRGTEVNQHKSQKSRPDVRFFSSCDEHIQRAQHVCKYAQTLTSPRSFTMRFRLSSLALMIDASDAQAPGKSQSGSTGDKRHNEAGSRKGAQRSVPETSCIFAQICVSSRLPGFPAARLRCVPPRPVTGTV